MEGGKNTPGISHVGHERGWVHKRGLLRNAADEATKPTAGSLHHACCCTVQLARCRRAPETRRYVIECERYQNQWVRGKSVSSFRAYLQLLGEILKVFGFEKSIFLLWEWRRKVLYNVVEKNSFLELLGYLLLRWSKLLSNGCIEKGLSKYMNSCSSFWGKIHLNAKIVKNLV